MKKEDGNNLIMKVVPAVLWLIIWEVASLLLGSELILPGPVSTVGALFGLAGTGRFWFDVLFTLARVALGIAISFGAGTACAVLAHRNRTLREFLRLPVSFFKSIPVMAIIIYVILIVKADWVAVVVCFFMCFPIAYTNMLSGLSGLDEKYEELAKGYDMTGTQRIRLIIRPALQPEISAAANLIAGMSWKVVVAAEVLAIPKFSIGYQMLNSKYYLNTPDLFAYIVVLIVLSLLMEKFVAYAAGSGRKRFDAVVRREVEQSSSVVRSSGEVKVSLADVVKSFDSDEGKNEVLSGINMEFLPGITALLGPSGRGKTTIMRLISGLDAPDSGDIYIEPLTKPDILFQEDRLLPWLTAEGNMMLAFLNRKGEGTDVESEIRDMADKLELSESLDMMPKELSGGMAHRVALGRALLSGGTLLILDEPMRGLDSELEKRVIGNIDSDVRYDKDGNRRTVILITHDEKLAEELGEREIRM